MTQHSFLYRTRLLLWLSFIFFSLCPKTAEANVLQDLFEAAIKTDDQLQIARAQLEEAKGQAQESLSNMLPDISIDSSFSQTSITACNFPNPSTCEDSTALRHSLTLNQPIYKPDFQRDYRISKARATQAGYEYGAAYFALFQRLLNLYLDILSTSDRIRTVQAQVEVLTKKVNALEAEVAVGARTTVDLNQARANLRLAETSLTQSRIQLRVFYEGLSESIGIDIKNLPPVRQDLSLPPLETVDAEHWKKIALERNPSLLAARKALEASHESRKQSNSKRLPNLFLSSSYTNSEQDFSGNPRASSSQTEIGLRLNIPIYAGGSVLSEVKQARARSEQRQRQVNLLEIEIRTLVPSLVRLIINGDDFIAAARHGMEAEKAVAVQVELGYTAGKESISDLLDAYARGAQAEQSYYATLYAHIRNYADFYIRTAQLNEENIKDFYAIADLSDYNANINPLLEEE